MPTTAEIADWSPYGRGTCAACGRLFDLTKAGKIRHHSGARGSEPSNWGGRAYRCPGAGQKPTTTPAVSEEAGRG